MSPFTVQASNAANPPFVLDPGIGVFVAVVAVVCTVAAGWYFIALRRSLPDLWRGLALGIRALIAKELRSRSRGWRPPVLLTFYLAILGLGVTGFLALAREVGGMVHPIMIGPLLFSTLSVGAVLLLAFITPALTTGAISGERERRTLDLLVVGRASALGLVTGKLLGSLCYILLLLIGALPAFAVVYLFGGVPPLYLGMVLAVGAVTALSHAALGLLLSAILRRTLVASAVSYVIVLGLVFGIPFVSSVLAITQPTTGTGLPPIYTYASPLVSLSSVLPSGREVGSIFGVGAFAGAFLYGRPDLARAMLNQAELPITQHAYVVQSDPRTGAVEIAITWAPWVYHFVLSGIFTVICLFWSALALTPVKPWHSWRARRRSPSGATAAPAEGTSA